MKYVVDADGSHEEPFGPPSDYEVRQVSPDESLLSIVGPNGHGMIVGGTIGVDGSQFSLFANPEPNLNLACGIWAPDDRMACEAWNDDDPSVAGIQTVLASDGSDPRRVTTGRDVPCDYSPDGSQLAFVRGSPDGNGSTLMVVNSKGGEPKALLEDIAASGVPCDWAPDGSSILTATTDGELELVSSDGDSTAFVGDGLDGHVFNGLWSSDGSRILLTMALQGEQGDVYTIAADGSGLRQITHSELLEEALTWLP
jgi:WD40 repeat protein